MNAPLPSWIERLLGIQPEAGEGTSWWLDQSWGWPPWLKLLAIVLLAGLVVATYWRESRRATGRFRMMLAAIRLILVGLVLVMLAQLTLVVQPTSLPYAVLIVDDSRSMTVADRYDDNLRSALQERVHKAGFGGLARWDLARTLLSENDGALLSALLERYRLRVVYLTGLRAGLGATSEEIAAELKAAGPNGETSPLGAAVRKVLDDLRGSTPAAVVILTDGINTEGPPLGDGAAYAARKGVPLYLVGMGDERPVRDVKMTDLLVDDEVFVNDVVYFEAQLTSAGYQGRQAQVVLRRQGQKADLARTAVALGPDGQSQQARLPYRPTEEGEFTYVLEVEPLEGELRTDNNRQERTVRATNKRVRVLLVQADPSWEYRYLRGLDRAESQDAARAKAADQTPDRAIDLHVVLHSADLKHSEQDRAVLQGGFPVQKEALSQYDVIILGDANPQTLEPSMIQGLVDFVEQPKSGGALIVIAGPKYTPLAWRNTPLARLLPIDLATARAPGPDRPLAEGFRVRPTELGRASPGMYLGDTPDQSAEVWNRLPPLYWLLEAPDLKRGARVLAEADHPGLLTRDGRRLPVILIQYVGAGKVLFHATDETWRWRYRAGDVYFARYWVQTIRYLARSKLKQGDRSVKLAADQPKYARGEPVRLWVRFADERQAPGKEDGVTVTLEHQGHQTRQVPLHRSLAGGAVFETVLSDLGAGAYHAFLAAPTLPGEPPSYNFEVVAPGEFDRVQMDVQAMQRAARQTKGQFYTLRTADRLLSELPEGYRAPVAAPDQWPLWNSGAMVLALLILLVGEWVLRKIGGMV